VAAGFIKKVYSTEVESSIRVEKQKVYSSMGATDDVKMALSEG